MRPPAHAHELTTSAVLLGCSPQADAADRSSADVEIPAVPVTPSRRDRTERLELCQQRGDTVLGRVPLLAPELHRSWNRQARAARRAAPPRGEPSRDPAL